MPTAEYMSGRFASYWSAVLPQLEQFVRLANLAPKRLDPALRIDFPAERQALVSETAFMLWAGRGGTRRSDDVELAFRAAQARLVEFLAPEHVREPLTTVERTCAERMASRIEGYVVSDLRAESLEIEPRLPGCGTVSGGVPDVIATARPTGASVHAVMEVKAVDRTFRSADFRQLVAYAALIFAERRYIPGLFAVMNPLRGTAVEVSTNAFFEHTAGRAADEVIQGLITEWSDPPISA